MSPPGRGNSDEESSQTPDQRLTPSAVRFRVDPRDVPPIKAARRLGLTLAQFDRLYPQLAKRGFPPPDASTGNFDLKAVEKWMDDRSSLTAHTEHGDAASILQQRLKAWDGGRKAQER